MVVMVVMVLTWSEGRRACGLPFRPVGLAVRRVRLLAAVVCVTVHLETGSLLMLGQDNHFLLFDDGCVQNDGRFAFL
jgi:hypothetical protein